MYYPYRPDYKCPDCKSGTMKWRAEEFHETYTLGRSFCDNPRCPNNEKNWLRLTVTKEEFENLIDKACDSGKPKPDSKEAETLELNQTDDCNENHIHPDNKERNRRNWQS